MIIYFNKIQYKKMYIILCVNKWFNIFLEDLIQQFLHMDKRVVVKLTQCLVISIKISLKE
jgi:hypothetical protein